MKKYLICLLLVCFIVSMLSIGIGCKTTATAETTAAETTATAIKYIDSKWVPGVKLPDVGKKKIAILGAYMEDALYMTGGIIDMQQLGWEIYFQHCNFDTPTQITQIEDLIARGEKWDAVIIDPVSSIGSTEAIKKMIDAGYPVFVYSTLPTGAPIKFYSTGDNHGLATLLTELTVKELIKKYGEPKGKVLGMTCGMEYNSLITRIDALSEVMAQYPNIQLVIKYHDMNADASVTTLQNALIADPTYDAVWNMLDWWAQYWTDALKEMNLLYPVGDPKHIIITSMDGHKFMLDNVEAGYVDIDVVQMLDLWMWGDVYAMANYFAGIDLNTLIGEDFGNLIPVKIISNDGIPQAVVGGIVVSKDKTIYEGVADTNDPRLWGNQLDTFDDVNAFLKEQVK